MTSSSFASSPVRPGDALELALLIGDEPLVFRRGVLSELFSRSPTVRSRAVSSFSSRSTPASRSASAASRRARVCSSVGRLLALLPRLALGLHEDLVRLFLGVEQRFLPPRLGVAFGVFDDAKRLRLGAADGFGGDALAVGHPHREDRGGGNQGDEDVDE